MSKTPGQKTTSSSSHGNNRGSGANDDQGNDLKSEAKQAFGNVSQRVKESASEAMQEVKQQVKEQTQTTVKQQQNVVADKLESVCEVVRDTAGRMREQNVPAIAGLIDQAADQIDSFSQYIRDTEFNQMLDGAHQWVRRNPALFLGGSFVVGMLLARVIKGATSGATTGGEYGSQFNRGRMGSQRQFGSQGGYHPSPSESRFGQHSSGQYGSSSFSTPLAGGIERPGTSGSSPSWEET